MHELQEEPQPMEHEGLDEEEDEGDEEEEQEEEPHNGQFGQFEGLHQAPQHEGEQAGDGAWPYQAPAQGAPDTGAWDPWATRDPDWRTELRYVSQQQARLMRSHQDIMRSQQQTLESQVAMAQTQQQMLQDMSSSYDQLGAGMQDLQLELRQGNRRQEERLDSLEELIRSYFHQD